MQTKSCINYTLYDSWVYVLTTPKGQFFWNETSTSLYLSNTNWYDPNLRNKNKLNIQLKKIGTVS